MINLFFVIHDYSGAKTYADELLGNISSMHGILTHIIYLESKIYKEYTAIEKYGFIEIHIPAVKNGRGKLEKYSKRCVDLIQPIVHGKKKLIFHLNYSNQMNFGVEAKNRFGAKLVFTLHYLQNYYSYLNVNSSIKEGLITTGNVLDHQIIKEIDVIICVTKFAKQVMNQFYAVQEEKTIVIYNGCSDLNYEKVANSSNKQNIKKQLGFYENDLIVLFVGRLSKGKGLEKLIKAFNQLTREFTKLKLIIVGEGDYTSFMKLSQQNFARIFYTGRIPQEQVKQLYQIADIGIIPSEYEQCSFVALEMMQYGLPIISTNASGLNELFRHNINSLLVSLKNDENGTYELKLNYYDLFKTIKKLIVNKNLKHKLGMNAKEDWKRFYTSNQMSIKTIACYKKVLQKKN